MGACVDFTFYASVYMGNEADEASFPALCARASDVIGAMTRWTDASQLSEPIATLYKKAVCAQADYFAVNGLDSVAGDDGRGFTVGKVSISGKSGSDIVHKGALSGNVSPLALMYLEQTGLMNPQVFTASEPPLVGWY
jgi:hypothetical protein